MYTETLKKSLLEGKSKRILLYGQHGLGKTYFANNIYEDIRGGFITVNFRSDDVTEISKQIKAGKDITEALVTAYRLSEELLSVTFILDEFTEPCIDKEFIEKLTETKKEYKYNSLRVIFITSDVSWAESHSDRFDECVKADRITFADFLRKSGDSFYAQVIDAHMTKKKSMPSLIHNELIDMFYQYLTTGGFPRPVAEITKENPMVFPDDLAGERYRILIGDICFKEDNKTSAYNKIQIINAIPECSKNSRFVISKTGRRHLSKQQLESAIEELINDGIIIKIPKIGSDSYSLALTDDGIYSYLLRINRNKLNLTEDRIKELVTENHIRNLLHNKGIKAYTYAGKYRFKINILAESGGKLFPIRVSCSKSTRSPNYDEFIAEYGDKTSFRIHFTESSFSESKGTVYLPVYGCEYLEKVIPQQ